MNFWEVLLAVVGSLALVYAVLLFLLWLYARRHPETVTAKDALRLIPDLLRTLKSLVADPKVPRGSKVWIAVVLGYLLLPIDLVPDFLPVIGWADDLIVVAIVLRHVLKTAGRGALERHWPGTPAGLEVLLRFTRAS